MIRSSDNKIGDSELLWLALEASFYIVVGGVDDPDLRDLNDAQRELAALLYLWVSIEHDGACLALTNSVGEWLPEAIAGAGRIGAAELARVLALLQEQFGPSVVEVRDQSHRIARHDLLPESHNIEIEERLSTLGGWFIDAERYVTANDALFFRPAPVPDNNPPSGGFDPAWASWTLSCLGKCHVRLDPPLRAIDIEALGAAFGVAFPEELALLLCTNVPVSISAVKWHNDPAKLAAMSRGWVVEAFRSDVMFDGFWNPVFGVRPSREAEIMGVVADSIAAAPVLIPMFGDHYLVALPDGPRPVISLKQPTEALVVGNDLADYFHRDYGIPRPTWSAETCVEIPFWGSLLNR